MKIKQQKQIKDFIIEEFKEEKLFHKQEVLLQSLIENIKNKSENQIKTLVQTILPRIALYKTFLNNGYSPDISYEYMRKYMINKVAIKKNASMKKNGISSWFLYFI